MFHFYIKILIACFVLTAASSGHAAYSAYVTLKNTYSGMCLEIKDSSKASGAILQQNKCTGAANQIFLAYQYTDGAYILKNKNSGLCVDIKNSVLTNGGVLQQVACTSASNQKFTPLYVRNSSGSYNLVSQLNGSCIHMGKASTTVGVAAVTYYCKNNNEQNLQIGIVSGSLPLINVDKISQTVITPVSGPSLPSDLVGVNITGAESGDYSSTYGYGYQYPTTKNMDYFARKGVTVIRVPFKSGRLQPTLSGALDATELSRLDAVVQYARQKGMYVILDPHDYGRMRSGSTSLYLGTDISAYHFGNFWARLAKAYSKQPNVIFNIMNEPNKQTAAQWQSIAITAISAIRAVNAAQLILIPGTSWTGAHSWVKSGNGQVWSRFKDPNYMMEIHQYLDSDSSGTHTACTAGSGSARLVAFKDWAKTYGKRAFLGEFGWADNSACHAEGYDLLDYMVANNSIFKGFSYFGAGWYNGFMTVNGNNIGTSSESDKNQMKVIMQYF